MARAFSDDPSGSRPAEGRIDPFAWRGRPMRVPERPPSVRNSRAAQVDDPCQIEPNSDAEHTAAATAGPLDQVRSPRPFRRWRPGLKRIAGHRARPQDCRPPGALISGRRQPVSFTTGGSGAMQVWPALRPSGPDALLQLKPSRADCRA